jgi:THO complex subunit 4
MVTASRVAKQTRRPRRGANVRAQVLGTTTGTSPAAKARIATAAKPASVSPQPVEKIVVSNLPLDVNEAQVKVR